MFKKLRKLYFKIYHLFKLLGIFILIVGFKNNVYAECNVLFETSGSNLYIETFARASNYYASIDGTTLAKVNPVANTNYTFFMTDSSGSVFNMNQLGFFRFYMLNNTFYPNESDTGYYKDKVTASTTSSDIIPFYFYNSNNQGNTNQSYLTIKELKMYVVEGTEICIPTVEPPGPEQDEVYSNFLDIYKDRLIYLTEGFTTNPYLIAMIGIIISFIVLELLLKIINIGGHRRK